MTVPVISAEQLKDGLAVAAEDCPVPMKRKLFAAPAVSLVIRFDPEEDAAALSEEQFAAFAKEFEAAFGADFELAHRTWFADLRKTVRVTETEISNLRVVLTPKAINERIPALVEEANQQLTRQCAVFAGRITPLAQAAYEAALHASYRAVKAEAVAAKAKVATECAVARPLVPSLTSLSVVAGTMDTPPSASSTMRTLPTLRS